MIKVLSVGGSIVVPDNPDTTFLSQFINMVKEWLLEDNERKLILVSEAALLQGFIKMPIPMSCKKQIRHPFKTMLIGLELWQQDLMLNL